tara:strand:- start:236 stop:415 length:180 start_codon:yes stop_codon:yes gene_type:complete
MTAKHFIAIAQVLRYLKGSLGAPVYKELVQAIANYCQSENERFNMKLFVQGCGLVEDGK